MKTTITTVLLGGLIALQVTASATTVLAQCAFERPTKNGPAYTGRYESTLVQAYVGCGNVGGNPPNATSQMGLPACQPPETFNTMAGSPAGGWHFSPTSNVSWGRVRLQRVTGAFSNPTGIRDLSIYAHLQGIVDASLLPANGLGVLTFVIRSTFDDPVSGDMTTTDFQVNVPINMVGGVGNTPANLTLATYLGNPSLPRFPDCTSHEIVSVAVLDQNAVVFAVPGVRIKFPG